ncbi:MAG: efflux RND transporter periplasmic adaptor subunit [bacterium]
MTRSKQIIWIIVILAVLAVVGFFIIGSGAKGPTVTTVKVERGDISERVTATGSVIPLSKYRLSFEVQGQIQAIPVKVGDLVNLGDPLVALDNRDALNNLAKANAQESSAYARLKQVTEGTRAEELFVAETQVANAEKEYERAKQASASSVASSEASTEAAADRVTALEAELDRTKTNNEQILNSDYEEGLSTLRSNINKLSQALAVADRMRRDYFMGRDLINHGLIIQGKYSEANQAVTDLANKIEAASSSKYELVDSAFLASQDAVTKTRDVLVYIRQTAIEDTLVRDTFSSTERTLIENERANVDLVDSAYTAAFQKIGSQKTSNSLALISAENALADAKSGLVTAERQLSATSDNTSSDVTRALSTLEQRQAELKLKRAAARSSEVNVALADLDAAKAGVEAALTELAKTTIKAPAAGVVTELNAEVGEVVSPSTRANPIAVMIATTPYEIEANVAEIDIPKIKLADPVEITFDAFSGVKFTGAVTEINPAETVVEGVIYYRIKVSFEDTDGVVKSGMTANLKLTTDSRTDVLLLPYVAVIRENDVDYVRVPDGPGGFTKREVKVGLQGESQVEILEGVTEGETIITYFKAAP